MYDVIIVGSGPAGLTAGIYTGRARLKTLILESSITGGNAGITDFIENYPGFPFGISGFDLIDNFVQQATRFGVELKTEEVIKITNTPTAKEIITDKGVYKTKTIIIATGAKRRELGLEGEKGFIGRGVSYCATCDGAFFKDAVVAVVGGGDSAVNEAIFLSDIAAKVYLIHRRQGFRANQTAVDKMLANEKIELKLDRVVSEIKGDGSLRKLVLQDVQTQAKEELPVEGLFVSIGLVPTADLVKDLVDIENGYIKTDENMATSVAGIFAAGDIRVKKTRQIATAVGDGAIAGMAVTEYLNK